VEHIPPRGFLGSAWWSEQVAHMKILVVGDSYCPWRTLGPAIQKLGEHHELTGFDVVDEPEWRPATPSERKVREYLGSPAQVIEQMDGPEVLVVQGAPVTDAVMDASPALKLVCVARGGPVNVDIAAATERGIAVTTTPGKNAQAVAELTTNRDAGRDDAKARNELLHMNPGEIRRYDLEIGALVGEGEIDAFAGRVSALAPARAAE
jgi:hypothetical protein